MTVGKKALSIGFDNIGWLDGLENGPDDYCAHAHAVARIGDETLEYEATVSATALYLLKSLSEDHRAYKEEQFLPCCGFNIFEKNDGTGDVVILGCPNGIDWDPVHSGDEVIIATDSGAVTAAPFGEYREEVLAFADKVEAFYDGQPPREPAEDEHIPMRLVYSKSTLSTRGCEARMDPIEVFKALANETRLNILLWLKDPGANFGPQGIHFSEPIDLKGGVCVESISERAGISKSTASSYLTMMRRAGLLLSERHGKWTYYRRNEKAIRELARYLDTEL